MTRYKNLGTAISIPVQDEYEIVAFIALVDRDKWEYKIDLSLRDVKAGMTIELDKSPVLISTAKTVKSDVLGYIVKLIHNGYFDEDVESIRNLYDCMMKLHDITHKEG